MSMIEYHILLIFFACYFWFYSKSLGYPVLYSWPSMVCHHGFSLVGWVSNLGHAMQYTFTILTQGDTNSIVLCHNLF